MWTVFFLIKRLSIILYVCPTYPGTAILLQTSCFYFLRLLHFFLAVINISIHCTCIIICIKRRNQSAEEFREASNGTTVVCCMQDLLSNASAKLYI